MDQEHLIKSLVRFWVERTIRLISSDRIFKAIVLINLPQCLSTDEWDVNAHQDTPSVSPCVPTSHCAVPGAPLMGAQTHPISDRPLRRDAMSSWSFRHFLFDRLSGLI